MKNVLKLEEFFQFALCIAGLYYLGAEWWWYLALVLGPDISMTGYLAGNRPGAILYNLFHHKGIASIVFAAGLVAASPLLMLSGIMLFGHSSMDRAFGYGLKYYEGFKFTHLGIIGKQ